MKYGEFKKYLNTICHVADSTADTWLEWAEELERCDSSDGELPKGTYRTADVFLGEFAKCIRMIQETHGNEIAAGISTHFAELLLKL